MPTSSAGLSFVPNVSMANSLTNGGAASMTRSPTSSTGERHVRLSPARSSATARATPASTSPEATANGIDGPASERSAGDESRMSTCRRFDTVRRARMDRAATSSRYAKFSQYRLGVGPRWPWYFEPVAPLPYGRSAGVVISMKLIWPIFIPG